MIDIRKYVKIKISVVYMLAIFMILAVQCVFCFMQITALDFVNIAVGTILFIILNRSLLKTIFGKMRSKLISK